MQSEAVLISRPHLDPDATALLERLLFRIRSVKAAAQNKYILLNAPSDAVDNIISILPGMKSPTVVPLAESGWVSIHSVISEHDFWEVVDRGTNFDYLSDERKQKLREFFSGFASLAAPAAE